jgi:hypothetical protein
MAAAAVPAISLGAQYFLNRGANKRTNTALDTATKGLQGTATDLGQFGTKLGQQAGGFLGDAQKFLGQAGTAYNQTANYFSPMLSGSRSAINQALAPERGQITDTYRGAEKALDASGMRGGMRDLARAELNRDRAGKLSLLGPSARAAAANGMMQVGGAQSQLGATQAGTATNLFGQAAASKQGATNAYATLFGGANQQAALAQPGKEKAGGAIGSMIFDAVKSGGKKGGGAPTINGLPMVPFAPTVPSVRP